MNLPQLPPTGEVFLMRSLDPVRKRWFFNRREPLPEEYEGWKALIETIERCGGKVQTVPLPKDPRKESAGTYFRDPGIILYDHEGKRSFIVPEQNSVSLRSTAAQMIPAIHEAVGLDMLEEMPGAVEGGQLVLDPHRNQIFWGITNWQHIRMEEVRQPEEIEGTTAKQRRLEDSRPMVEAANHAEADFAEFGLALAPGKPSPKVIPIFIGDEEAKTFFHLDGALGMLPSGEAIVCRDVLPRVSQLQIEKAVGRDNIISISREEALKGAANIITVGSHIITPYASDMLKEKLQARGYTVIDPTVVGLPEGAWELGGRLAGPHCATLKLTPDQGFPAPQAPSRSV